MDFRENLLRLLEAYSPADPEERRARSGILDFVAGSEVLGRGNPAGHVTGSALVVNPDRTKMLLNHHAKLDRWMQFGGHVEEGDATVAATAAREAREESGIEGLAFVSVGVFDVDVHLIPARAGAPAHRHYDIRFLLEAAEGESPVASEESKSVRWVALEDVARYSASESVARMARKVGALGRGVRASGRARA